jgi:hypothetical protein
MVCFLATIAVDYGQFGQVSLMELVVRTPIAFIFPPLIHIKLKRMQLQVSVSNDLAQKLEMCDDCLLGFASVSAGHSYLEQK